MWPSSECWQSTRMSNNSCSLEKRRPVIVLTSTADMCNALSVPMPFRLTPPSWVSHVISRLCCYRTDMDDINMHPPRRYITLTIPRFLHMECQDLHYTKTSTWYEAHDLVRDQKSALKMSANNTACSPTSTCPIMTGTITNGTNFVAQYDPLAPKPRWRAQMELATIIVCNFLSCKIMFSAFVDVLISIALLHRPNMVSTLT